MRAKYCFDTSALIEPWVRRYPPDVFPRVWDKLIDLSSAGIICAPAYVFQELERQKDDLFAWVKKTAGDVFVQPDRTTMELYTHIVNNYPGFVKPESNRSAADPFVVATAMRHGIPVVTYETRAKANAAPKIPNVCDDCGVRCIDLVDVLRAEGFKQ